MPPGKGELRFTKAPWLDPLEAGINDADEMQRREERPFLAKPGSSSGASISSTFWKCFCAC
jgi:hypothetical protein